MSYAASPYNRESCDLGSANDLLRASVMDAKSDQASFVKSSFSRIKVEIEDSLDLDEEEDSHYNNRDLQSFYLNIFYIVLAVITSTPLF